MTKVYATLPDADSDGCDPRFPTFSGFWQRPLPHVNDAVMSVDNLDEPHAKRRKAILAVHPEIASLSGIEPRTKWVAAASVSAMWALAYYFGAVYDGPWWGYALAGYFLGAPLAALQGVIMHDCAHSLAAPSLTANRWLAMLSNAAVPVPIAMSFRRYHLEHHAYQGVVDKDPDLPLAWERSLMGKSWPFKLVWLLIYPVMYVTRGAVMSKVPSFWELVNVGTTVAADALAYAIGGWGMLGFMFLSLWFGYSIHPGAAHFIQEHYSFADGQETYSYYGSWNRFFLNIGYHNEHHDFSKVPWSRLPQIRSTAPEFYDSIHAHYSWTMVLVNFVLSPAVAPVSRVVRSIEDHRKGRKMPIFRDEQAQQERLKKLAGEVKVLHACMVDDVPELDTLADADAEDLDLVKKHNPLIQQL